MQRASFQWGGAAAAAVLALLMNAPAGAADNNGVRPVAEELGQRTKTAEPAAGQSKGLSDSAVRVLMTYAFSVIPENSTGPDGKPIKVDKASPNKFLIPVEDARRVIRAATRSAYAEVCQLPELQQANYRTLMRSEKDKKIWTQEQMMLIDALHMFSVSYFSGSVQIIAKEEPADGAAAEGAGATEISKGAAAPQSAEPTPGTEVITPKRPDCPPEQKQKVTNAINAYVQAEAPAAAAAKSAPVAGASN